MLEKKKKEKERVRKGLPEVENLHRADSPSLRRDGSRGDPASAPWNRQSQRARTDVRFTQRARAAARRPRSWPSIPQDRRAGPGESRRRGGTQGPSLHLGPGPPRPPRPPTLLGRGVEGRSSAPQLWVFTLARRLGRRRAHLGQAARSCAAARKRRPEPIRRRLRLTRLSRARPARASARRPPTRRALRVPPPPPPRSRTHPRPARTEAAGADAAPPAASLGSQTTFPTRPRGRGVDFGVRRRRPKMRRSGSSRWLP